jgi:hypothetical protein
VLKDELDENNFRQSPGSPIAFAGLARAGAQGCLNKCSESVTVLNDLLKTVYEESAETNARRRLHYPFDTLGTHCWARLKNGTATARTNTKSGKW